MDYLLKVVALLVTASAIAIHLASRARRRKPWPSNLPPGSLGLPVIGQTLGILRAFRANTLDRWILNRIDRYGPVWKLSLLCTPTVLLSGPAANKFIFYSSLLRTRMPRSFRRIFGEKSIMDLHGDDHRRVRGALMEFLRPDTLKLSVGRVDAKVRQQLEKNWRGHKTVTVLPLMKRMTFDVISALLFGIEPGAVQDDLADDFGRMMEGVFAVPLNLPFTAFRRSLAASRRARRLLDGITRDKKAKLVQPKNDLLTGLLSLRDDHGEQLLTDEEIVDSGLFALVVGHDSTAVLMTFMLRHLANDPATLAAMEHEEIASNKADDGVALTWEDLSRMKFTWQLAQEALRLNPPAFGGGRTASEDVEFDGYCIPKGWQVFWIANLTHMDPSIFPEPTKLDPSRFESQQTPPCCFVPFGGGQRLCPGIEFTKIETLVTMHYLVRQFRWKLCCDEKSAGRDLMLLPPEAVQIELEHKASL